MNYCAYCFKPIENHLNYCNFECNINLVKADPRCKIITPNKLPICVITHDYKLMEHSEASHQDYKFPIEIVNDRDNYEHNYEAALIYTDGYVAVSLYYADYKTFTYNFHEKVFELGDGACSISLKSTRKIIKYALENKTDNQY